MMRTFRRRLRRRSGSSICPTSLAAEVQSLERRSLPTGTVTAALSGQSLTIGGDNLDNNILIEIRTDGIFLTGLPDEGSDPATFTKIQFGGETFSAGEEVQLTNAPTLKHLTILMRGGNDNVRIHVGVAAGSIDPEDAPTATITGRVRINLGRGNDHGVVLLNNGTLSISGNLEGDLENGDDCLLVGTNEVLAGGADLQEPIEVGGSVIILGRLGSDFVGLGDVNVGRSVTIDSGDHADALTLQTVAVDGNLSIIAAGGDDDLSLNDVTVAGSTAVRGGAGNDRVVVNGFTATKNVAVYLASGEDQISLSAMRLDESARVTIDGGSGTDALASSDPLLDPPVTLSRLEDTEAQIDTAVITDGIATRIADCLDATEPPLEP